MIARRRTRPGADGKNRRAKVQEGEPGDLETIWRTAREELEASLPRSTFNLWLAPLRLVGVHGSTLYLSAPDGVREWVERRYATLVLEALRRHTPSVSAIAFMPAGSSATAEGTDGAPTRIKRTFDNFVIGAGNRFAHSAALAVAEMPGEAYNPLFLYGAPGLGKTHLLSAIAAYMRDRDPAIQVHHTTAEAFTGEFVAALRRSGTDAFKRRYRCLDALLIDDVQFLEDKPQTEEEFFHTFNALYEAGSQIVLSSDRPPHALSRLAERLRDRFEWGLCAEIAAADARTRLAVLTRLAAEAVPELSREEAAAVLREIASHAPGNLRRLEGALTRVIAFGSVMGTPLTPELARQVLGPTPEQDKSPLASPESVEAVQDAVCAVLHVSRDELLSTRRKPSLVKARQLAIYVSRLRLSLSLTDLARAFGRDRTTILHSLRAVERELTPGTATARALQRVQQQLDGVGKPPRG
jgi:chromosomal replication initiator protein